MSIHAVDKKNGFFCVESGPKLIYFLVICVNRMGSKNRGILLIEMWKLRKRLSVAKLVTKCDQAPQTSIEHTSTCVLPEIQPSSPREEALTASSVTHSSLGYLAANRISTCSGRDAFLASHHQKTARYREKLIRRLGCVYFFLLHTEKVGSDSGGESCSILFLEVVGNTALL